MATVNLTVGQVINFAAARLNDAGKQLYDTTVQLPFINVALAELQEIYQANNIPVTDETTSDPITVPATTGFAYISPDDDVFAEPFYPDDMLEPKVVWVSPTGQNQWFKIKRVDTLPQWQIDAQINQLLIYQWATNRIKFIGANADNDVKLDYIRALFTEVTSEDDQLNVQNSLSFLGNRTASLIAHDIEENDKRSQDLYADAIGGLDRALTIPTKGRQRITIRRRPFRSGYKATRGVYTR